MGRRGHVDSGQAKPGSGGQDRGWGVSAALVDAGTSEAGHNSERGGSGFCGDSKAAGDSVPDGIPETLHGADGFADEYGGRQVQDHALYRAGGGGVAAVDRLRKRGEPAAGAGDDAGKRVCDPGGTGGEPVAADPAATGRELAAGRRWGGGGDTARVGRPEVAGGADAAEYYSGGSGDPDEYAGAGVHAGDGGSDGAGVWAGAGAKSGAQGFKRALAGQRQGDQRRIPPRAPARRGGGAGSGAFVDAAGGGGTADEELCGASGRAPGIAAGSYIGGKAAAADGPLQNGRSGDGILPAAAATAESAAGRDGSDGNQHAATVRRNSERHRNSRKDARGKMECDVSAGQRGIFPGAENPVRGRKGFHRSGSEWSAQAGDREPDVREKVSGERESDRETGKNRAAGGV